MSCTLKPEQNKRRDLKVSYMPYPVIKQEFLREEQ